MQPGRPVEEYVSYSVKRLQHMIRAALDARLSDHGVSMAAYAAMAVLAQEPMLSNADLARRCFVTPQTMHAIVQGLAESGVVERRAHPEHGRVVQTRLSRRGRALVARCHREVEAVHALMLADLNVAEQAELTDLLGRCIDALDS